MILISFSRAIASLIIAELLVVGETSHLITGGEGARFLFLVFEDAAFEIVGYPTYSVREGLLMMYT